MKKILLIIGAILLVAVIAAGSFWGGMAYQSDKTDQVRAAFELARGPANLGASPGDAQAFPLARAPGDQPPGFAGALGAMGVVKAIEGNLMTLSTAQDVKTVNLSESTRVEKSVAGELSELQAGMRVMVAGEKDSAGNITASQVTILNPDPAAIPGGSAPETEP